MAHIKINIIDVDQDHEISQDEIITSTVPDSNTGQTKQNTAISHIEKSIMKIKPKKERIHDKGFEL